MTRGPRHRFWLEAGAATIAAFLTLLTLVTREWIELVFGADPDGGSGVLEWFIVAGFLVIAMLLSLMATREWRTVQRSGASG
jgi:hypothetical protein